MATSRVGSSAPAIAARALDARRSAIREVFDAANKVPDAIRLEIGEPSFHTPRFIVTPPSMRSGGSPLYAERRLPSRCEPAEKIERVDGVRRRPDSVVVTPAR
jgi:aspartate/methionine/tyrosine aminotransferase